MEKPTASVPSIPEKGEEMQMLSIGDKIKIVSKNRSGDYFTNKEIKYSPLGAVIDTTHPIENLQVNSHYEVTGIYQSENEIIGFFLKKIQNPNIPTQKNSLWKKISNYLDLNTNYFISRKNLQNLVAKKIK